MKRFRNAKFLVLMILLLLGGGIAGCESITAECEREGGCTKECINQADCSNNQTCLNSGVCACFADQNGAQCSNLSDCAPDQACNASCQCVPNLVDAEDS